MNYVWTGVAILLGFVLGWKCLPLGWHARVFYMQWRYSGSKPIQRLPGAIFERIIVNSYAPLLEMDYNLHKSNSTFFSDMDISRAALLFALISPGLKNPSLAPELKGSKGIILAGVWCSFRRELLPFARFQMQSHILAWDQKWLYILTEFVPRGGNSDESGKRRVYATALSRYVCKAGRVTVPPEQLLNAAGLLSRRASGNVATADDEWTWERVEVERQRGMNVAKACSQLDKLSE